MTILIDEEDESQSWATDDGPRGRALRDRLARLLSLVELRTGARVIGSVGDLRPLRGRWYDAIVDPELPRTALP